MKKKIILTLLVAVVACLVGASVAKADGYLNGIRVRYYSDYVHFRIAYSVFDGNCVQDQYGGYNDPACYDFADGDATIGVQLYRTGGWIRHGGRKHYLHRSHVFGETADGFNGVATEDIYSYQERTPYCGYGTTYRINFKVVFTLIDPNDNAVDHMTRYYYSYCK